MTYLCNNAAFTIPHRAFTRFTTIPLLLGFALQVWVDIGVPRVDSTPRVDRTLRVGSIPLPLGFALQVWVDIGVPRVDSAPRVDRTLQVDSILGADRRFLALE